MKEIYKKLKNEELERNGSDHSLGKSAMIYTKTKFGSKATTDIIQYTRTS